MTVWAESRDIQTTAAGLLWRLKAQYVGWLNHATMQLVTEFIACEGLNRMGSVFVWLDLKPT